VAIRFIAWLDAAREKHDKPERLLLLIGFPKRSKKGECGHREHAACEEVSKFWDVP
jgi:hypothetical protein